MSTNLLSKLTRQKRKSKMMKEKIQEICQQYRCSIVNIDTTKELEHIYQLLIDKKLFHPDTSTEFLYFGYYYNHIEKDYELMKKYYLIAIEKGNSSAMHNLGYYYHYIEEDYELMKKYYDMAIEKGHSDAMSNFGHYYHFIKKDYENMKKYYKMAITDGNIVSMNNLGYYYHHIKNDYNNMKKYYHMAIEKGNSDAMNNFGYYYNHIEKDYENMKKYYLMAIEKGNSNAMRNLGYYYHHIENDYNNMKKYYLTAIEKGNENSKKDLLKYYTNSNEHYEDGLKFFITYYPENLHQYLPKIFQKKENITPKITSLLITIEDLTQIDLVHGLYIQELRKNYRIETRLQQIENHAAGLVQKCWDNYWYKPNEKGESRAAIKGWERFQNE